MKRADDRLKQRNFYFGANVPDASLTRNESMVDVWCWACGRYMVKNKTGIKIIPSEGVERRGDLYHCESCGTDVVSDFGTSYDVRKK